MTNFEESLYKALTSVQVITPLLSRDLFSERLARLSMASVLCVSIQGMGRIQLHFGHDVASRLRWAVCCRVMNVAVDPIMYCDGDYVYLAVESPADPATLAERIQDSLVKPYSSQDVEFGLPEGAIYLQTRIGIASHHDGQWPDDLIRSAGLAAYYAENHSGDDIAFYDPLHAEYDHSALFLEQALAQAVTQEQLTLFYQPQLDVETATIIGYEALLRWFHPVLGMVPTLQAVNILQRSNLLNQVSIWAIQKVSEVLVRWKAECPESDIKISVNLPPTIFITGWQTFRKVLIANAANASNIVLEITESSNIGDANQVLFGERLAEAQELGYQVSVDDFGTGFANFDQIRNFSFDELKLDKSFVRGVPSNEHDCELVVSMIRYASSRDMLVTAEGVETSAQFEFLKQHGCQKIQGYLISPPVPENEAFEFLMRQTEVARELVGSLGSL